MEKRLILAVTLSLLILLGWSALLQKIAPESTTRLPPSSGSPTVKPQPQIVAGAVTPAVEPSPASLEKFTLDQQEVIFNASQGAIQEVIFARYQAYKFPLQSGFLLGDQGMNFKRENLTPDSITFVYRDQNKQITKKFVFHNSNYTIDLAISVRNLSSGPLQVKLPLILGRLNFAADPNQARFQDTTVALSDKILHPNGRKDLAFNSVKFLALRDRYFCAIIEPLDSSPAGFIKKVNAKESEIGLGGETVTLTANQQLEEKFRIYLGPQDLRLLKQLKPEWTAVMYFGSFNFIAHLLLQFLEFLYSVVKNWGWAIVILSIAIYFLLFPLTLKYLRFMKEMQKLQPHLEVLRATYKDNPQKLQKEQMELFRKYKVNPFGGCLPFILQIPIFLALLNVLQRCISLKGAHFLWIKDLSEPDRLFTLPFALPILGNAINLLPILMTAGMFIQQKMSATSGVSSEQQKLMVIVLPLVFGVVFYQMPSSLVLYWLINSSLTLASQLQAKRSIA